MTKNLPAFIPLPRALLVFEAAARHGSFTAAASEFNVTQPSISRTVAQLEKDLGFQLFKRHSKGLYVTAGGQQLLASVQKSMEAIGQTIRAIQGNTGKRLVTLSMSNSFTTQWLIPRLKDFNEAFPDIELRFELAGGVLQDVTKDVDIATRIVVDNDPRYEIRDLAPEIILPVSSADYLARYGSIDDVASLPQQVFLHLTDHKRDQWQPFLGNAALKTDGIGIWNQFSDYAVILQAAAQGKGVALGWISVIANALRDGTLVPASSKQHATGRIHRLVIPKNRDVPPETHEICDWFQREMADDLKKLGLAGAF